jgi:FkbM family methyltransferase
MKRRLGKIFDSVAFKLGYQRRQSSPVQNVHLDVYHKNNLLDNFYSILQSIHFNPKHIVDVGANHGTWTRETLKHFPDSRYTLIEPQAFMKNSISDLLATNTNINFYAVGAGKNAGTFNFTITERDDSCSFRYSAEEARSKNLEQIAVNIITLNEFITEKSLPFPYIIKIDSEGLDLEVLEGASDFFGKTEIFLTEAGVVNKSFKNSFLKVINFMDENNYRLFDITDLNRPFERPMLWLTELVFVKKDGFIDSHKWT